jgi:amidase/aspartyl-tRNA(Asn)/glutamyl-tRNA(Gln) amidotransferase subunit A
MDDYAWATVAELAAAIRSKDLSPVELVDGVLASIEARNPSIDAFVYLAHDEARLAAKRAEDDVMSARSRS